MSDSQRKAWDEIQLLKKELERWRITKVDKDISLYSTEGVKGCHILLNENLVCQNNVRQYIHNIIRQIGCLRYALKPKYELNSVGRYRKMQSELVATNLNRLPRIAWWKKDDVYSSIQNLVVRSKDWDNLAKNNCVVVGNKFIIKASLIRTTKEGVEIYEVKYVKTIDLEEKAGLVGMLGPAVSVGSTESGVVRGVKKLLGNQVLRSLLQ